MRTIVWKRKAGGRRPPAVDHGIEVRIDLDQGKAIRINHDWRRLQEVLGEDEEVTILCSRVHDGFRDAEGRWHEGERGSIVVSTERFKAALKRSQTLLASYRPPRRAS
jgi:hypothetical protein